MAPITNETVALSIIWKHLQLKNLIELRLEFSKFGKLMRVPGLSKWT